MESRSHIPVGPPISNPLPSYWHNPKSPLANVIEPETEAPSQPYDYAIIGSGISGAMIAYNLLYSDPNPSTTHAGPRIVMLEAREICGGATGRNGGHTKAASYRTYLQHRDKFGKEEALKIARLEYSNIIATHQMVNELEIECDNQRCNTVDLIYDEGTFQQGKQSIEALRNDATEDEKMPGGMAWYKVYEKDDGIQQKFWVSDTNTNPASTMNGKQENLVGAFEYIAGRINAYKLATGIIKLCVQKGLQLCANTPVHSILPRGPEMYEVFTQRSVLGARNVILATNGYTPYLLPSLQGAIVPLRGQITTQQPPRSAVHPSVLPRTFSFIYAEGYEYMVSRNEPDGTQHVVIGGGLGRLSEGGASEFGTVDDSRLNDEVSEYLRGTLTGYFGSAHMNGDATGNIEDTRYNTVQEWTGIMGATADGLPFVGEIPGKKGMWILAGFNGHGMVLCLKSADALARMLTDDGKGNEDFPESFLITEERVKNSVFRGRADMRVPETQGGPVGCGINA
ncbi:unnamed protein product [Periconia digitata]|uniref:FAD dependent oxidoreductase domain-containing protein n=1 Tax=Periconia digitata TaxID=1303443 RepID=A0A9W4UC22_9PLEO|nr:unnamed protein product [Periconia digitata]